MLWIAIIASVVLDFGSRHRFVIQADVVEVNHYVACDGSPIFDQIIWWDWEGDRFIVREWRMVKHRYQLPLCDWSRGGYVSPVETSLGEIRVRAGSYRETWSDHDPEAENRSIVPLDQRRRFVR
jgi:hypothetical protein